MFIEAVKQNVYAIVFVKNQEENICIETVKQNVNILQFMKYQRGNMYKLLNNIDMHFNI